MSEINLEQQLFDLNEKPFFKKDYVKVPHVLNSLLWNDQYRRQCSATDVFLWVFLWSVTLLWPSCEWLISTGYTFKYQLS